MKALLAVLPIIACGVPLRGLGGDGGYNTRWCYQPGEDGPPCPSPDEFATCYLDAEQREAIAKGAPDLRPAWCFPDAGRPMRETAQP